jgi:hypothetical protein
VAVVIPLKLVYTPVDDTVTAIRNYQVPRGSHRSWLCSHSSLRSFRPSYRASLVIVCFSNLRTLSQDRNSNCTCPSPAHPHALRYGRPRQSSVYLASRTYGHCRTTRTEGVVESPLHICKQCDISILSSLTLIGQIDGEVPFDEWKTLVVDSGDLVGDILYEEDDKIDPNCFADLETQVENMLKNFIMNRIGHPHPHLHFRLHKRVTSGC